MVTRFLKAEKLEVTCRWIVQIRNSSILHVTQSLIVMQPCWDFVNTGDCQYGPQCRFKHSAAIPAFSQSPKAPISPIKDAPGPDLGTSHTTPIMAMEREGHSPILRRRLRPEIMALVPQPVSEGGNFNGRADQGLREVFSPNVSHLCSTHNVSKTSDF